MWPPRRMNPVTSPRTTLPRPPSASPAGRSASLLNRRHYLNLAPHAPLSTGVERRDLRLQLLGAQDRRHKLLRDGHLHNIALIAIWIGNGDVHLRGLRAGNLGLQRLLGQKYVDAVALVDGECVDRSACLHLAPITVHKLHHRDDVLANDVHLLATVDADRFHFRIQLQGAVPAIDNDDDLTHRSLVDGEVLDAVEVFNHPVELLLQLLGRGLVALRALPPLARTPGLAGRGLGRCGRRYDGIGLGHVLGLHVVGHLLEGAGAEAVNRVEDGRHAAGGWRRFCSGCICAHLLPELRRRPLKATLWDRRPLSLALGGCCCLGCRRGGAPATAQGARCEVLQRVLAAGLPGEAQLALLAAPVFEILHTQLQRLDPHRLLLVFLLHHLDGVEVHSLEHVLNVRGRRRIRRQSHDVECLGGRLPVLEILAPVVASLLGLLAEFHDRAKDLLPIGVRRLLTPARCHDDLAEQSERLDEHLRGLRNVLHAQILGRLLEGWQLPAEEGVESEGQGRIIRNLACRGRRCRRRPPGCASATPWSPLQAVGYALEPLKDGIEGAEVNHGHGCDGTRHAPDAV
mmetsp:Transcript_96079/g.213951  ORF Transcript_96079/g.213951 Transcript_96079/m.213951 type:complete len:572 (+) Transcript_96079:12-1727(+)